MGVCLAPASAVSISEVYKIFPPAFFYERNVGEQCVVCIGECLSRSGWPYMACPSRFEDILLEVW
jgi:hypothetical protein